jgi:hypothetical protein
MDIIAKLRKSDRRFEVRRAVIGDEPVLGALRLQALTDSPKASEMEICCEIAASAVSHRMAARPHPEKSDDRKLAPHPA